MSSPCRTFLSGKFEDHYEAALQDLLNKKQEGLPIDKQAPEATSNVIDIMSALRASLKSEKTAEAPAKKSKPKAKPAPKRKADNAPGKSSPDLPGF